MKLSYLIAGMVLALAGAGSSAQAVSIGAPTGPTAAQSPLLSAQGRFATDDIDTPLLASLSSGGAGALYALGAAVDVRYLGTDAARSATLTFDGSALFDTRSGCNFATALVDEFCLIDSIGTARALADLATGTALDFTLTAQPQLLGSASEQRTSAQSFSSLASARWIDLGGGK